MKKNSTDKQDDYELREEYNLSKMTLMPRGRFDPQPSRMQAYQPTTALAKTVKFSDEMMQVHLTDGRIISVPAIWFPLLHEAIIEQREHYEIGGSDGG